VKRVRICYPILSLSLLSACSRVPEGHVRLQLKQDALVSMEIVDEAGQSRHQPLTAAEMSQGTHEVDVTGFPPGEWKWRAVATAKPTLEPVAVVAAGVLGQACVPGAEGVAGGDAGPPCAVAADDSSVFLGWRGAREGHEVVACEPGGKVLWGHHHGPGQSGVVALAADGGTVFVLSGEALYKLDAKTGKSQPWEGRTETDLPMVSLWPADSRVKPARAEAVAAKNGRVYLTFQEDQFMAALDARTGAYAITLTAPHPTQLALSITPLIDPETRVTRPVDFGVAAIAGNGLAYFLMDHEPPWVMGSTTRWLQPDERVVALVMRGDTMKTDKVTIYTALGAPHHQVQLRPAEDVEGFEISVGVAGGREEGGPWKSDALRDVRSLAVDATGQLWVAEGDEKFGRLTVWKTGGKQATLVREIFGPMKGPAAFVDEHTVDLGGMRWRLDEEQRGVRCLGFAPEKSATLATATADLRDGEVILWPANKPLSAATVPSEALSFHRVQKRVFATTDRTGAQIFAVRAFEQPAVVGSGSVSIPRR
jgi:hypothetical protein